MHIIDMHADRITIIKKKRRYDMRSHKNILQNCCKQDAEKHAVEYELHTITVNTLILIRLYPQIIEEVACVRPKQRTQDTEYNFKIIKFGKSLQILECAISPNMWKASKGFLIACCTTSVRRQQQQRSEKGNIGRSKIKIP